MTHSTPHPWSHSKKILFRFCFLFFPLYIFFQPNGFLPYYDDYAFNYYIIPLHKLIPWIGKHILHLPYEITQFTYGSGDTTYDYLMLLLVIVGCSIGCCIWTLIDRRRISYNNLSYWLTALIRYYFAFTMFNYGFAKIFKIQFPFPGPSGLLATYGGSSPMHLAWSFFGYSRAYNYFMGFSEVTCGLLLLFRPCIRLGTLFGLILAVNIMAVNYCYDICVKLLSTMMLVMCLFLLLQDRQHLANFFFLNRHNGPQSRFKPQFRKKWLNSSFPVFKYVFIAFVLYRNIIEHAVILKENTIIPPLYGIYDVQSFVKNKDTLAPLTTDTVRWRKWIVTPYGPTIYSTVKLMNDSSKRYEMRIDTLTKKIVMLRTVDTTKRAHLVYSYIGKDSLLLRGKWTSGDSVLITLKKYDLNNFLLISREPHLINEVPFNR